MNIEQKKLDILSTRFKGHLQTKNFQYTKGGHNLLITFLTLFIGTGATVASSAFACVPGSIVMVYVLPYNKETYNSSFAITMVVILLFLLYFLLSRGFNLLFNLLLIISIALFLLISRNQDLVLLLYLVLTIVVFFMVEVGAYSIAFSLLFVSVVRDLKIKNAALFCSVFFAGYLQKISVNNLKYPPSPEFKLWMEVVGFLAILLIIIAAVIIAYRARKGSDKFTWLWKQAVFWSAIGGTSFYEVDLTDANFYCAQLPHTDFRKATLTRTNFEGVTGLEYSRLQGTILEQPKVRHLLTTKIGRNENYTAANLNGANVKGADLTGANLSGVQALAADFSGAILTGACIQDWKINSETNLDGIICEYIYLRKNQQERRPISGNFEPGEFTKLFQESLDTVDLIFREGIDWRAFAYSFQNAQVVNEDTPLAIQSIENKGDGVVVIKVNAPPGADKEKIFGSFWQGYEFAYKALDYQYQAKLKDKEQQHQARLEDKEKHINQLFSLLSKSQEKLGETPKYYLNNAQFAGGLADKVEGNQTGGTQYN